MSPDPDPVLQPDAALSGHDLAPRSRPIRVLFGAPLVVAALLIAALAVGQDRMRAAAGMVLRAEADLGIDAVFRRLHDRPPPMSAEALDAAQREAAADGVRYVELARPDRSVAFTAGSPPASLAQARELAPDGVDRVGDLVWARSLPIVHPMSPPTGLGPPPPGGFDDRQATLLVCLTPHFAPTLERAATMTLLASIGVVLALLALTAVAWRSVRARDAAVRLRERDRHLATIGNMSAVLAHQIRNPLASLKGHAQLLVEQLEGHGNALHAGYVVEEAIRIEDISTSLLDLTRAGAVQRQAVVPADLARDVARQLGAARIVVEDSGAPATWMLDPLKIHQVLANVVDNALEASPPDQPVEVACRTAAGALVFDVADRGPGVPAADRERIFEAFVTTRIRGTGLGLSVARQFVAAHGGSIDVEDRRGGGAVFRITLPAGS